MYNFNYPQQQVVPQQVQAPRIYTLEVIDKVEDLNYRSAPTNGNPAYYMLANDNKIYQVRWNGRTNEISAFNVFPCVEYQQAQQPQQQIQQQKQPEDRLSKVENTVNNLALQMADLMQKLGGNNEPTSNGNVPTGSSNK